MVQQFGQGATSPEAVGADIDQLLASCMGPAGPAAC